MSSNQPRQLSGVPAGGQFAVAPMSETGTFLTPEPGWDTSGLVASSTEQLAGRRRALTHLEVTDLVLRDQEVHAVSAVAQAKTAAQAREAGATLADVRFLRATVALESELTRDEIAHIEARIYVAKDSAAAIKTVLHMGQAPDRDPLIAALDAESDQGPGHIGYHPWLNPARTAAMTDLIEHLEVLPDSPDAAGWAEELTVLRDPLHVRRTRVAARNAAGPTSPEALAYERARAITARSAARARSYARASGDVGLTA